MIRALKGNERRVRLAAFVALAMLPEGAIRALDVEPMLPPGIDFEGLNGSEMRHSRIACEQKGARATCTFRTTIITREVDGACWVEDDVLHARAEFTRVGRGWWRALEESPICPNYVTSLELRFGEPGGWVYSVRTVETSTERSKEDCRLQPTWIMPQGAGGRSLACTAVRFGVPPSLRKP